MMTKWIYNTDRARISTTEGEIMNVYGRTPEERDEHGYLIAAAPELLAACKNAKIFILKVLMAIKNAEIYDHDNIYKTLEDAIKLAEGKP